ncbi:pentapeptide repeat-containing protein, partial [Amycolatopsis sp. NPDC003731]
TTAARPGSPRRPAPALLLAVRRQQHNESDATEKNVTELYTKAADQLGSEKAPVRMAGLYALERLAHNNPGQRQSIVNVICAYLRMPFNPPNAQPTAEADEAQRTEHHSRVQEQEVRLAAQRILADHLEPGNRQTFWPDTDLDLTNAILIRFKLKDCRVRTASFRDATFIGGVVFTGSTFTGDAWFAGTAFGDNAWFVDTAFAGDARFDRAIFTSDAVFARATFSGDAWFHSATFTVTAWFGMHGDGATFSGDARFSAATFNGNARFDDVTFTGNARFDDATFTGNACFEDASFTGDAVFSGVDFAGRSVFVGTTFNKGLPLTLSDDALSPG